MKKIMVLSFFLSAFIVFAVKANTITSIASGNWNDSATWDNGIPGAADDVVIDTSNSVTIDIPNAECNDLHVIGKLYFDVTKSDNGITIYGNVIVEGRFRPAETSPAIASSQNITFYGDLTVNSGGVFDMRNGSGSTVAVGRVLFTGNSNSTINLSKTTYSSTIEEFNSVEINKTGGAKVILASGNLFMNNNTSNSADTLLLTSGIVETGSNFWVTLRTSHAAILGASDSSYFNGNLGRGVSNGGGNTNVDFPIGDSATYRPINIHLIGPPNSTGHYVWVTIHNGNANTGSSTFGSGIDKVSELRYYETGYNSGASGATTMQMYGFSPTYKVDDGVSAGNTDLRVAYSTDAQSTWNDAGPSDHMTDPPDTLVSDSLTAIDVNSGESIFVSLARLTGTTTNSLGTATGVNDNSNYQPTSYNLLQNYPNPFNPSTTINYSIPKSGNVKILIHDLLGKEVATLVNGFISAGTHEVNFNAANLVSGIYFYSINAGSYSKTMKMILLK